jgi:endo-1,4-beta-D-glucanase Y
MNRRELIAGLAASLAATAAQRGRAGAAPAGPLAALAAAWALWKERHLDGSGRVVDALQGNASHSEGQGYALALASLLGDEAAAERIVAWTDANLARRADALLAWRWFPDGAVRDDNNAADGDLFFAWGCLRGGRTFGRAAWVERAARIAGALATSCLVPDPRRNGRLLLLPAAEGFRKESGVTVNPSYLMPRLMEELGEAADRPELVQAARDGTALLAELAVAGTTPDWIAITPRGGPRRSGTLSDRTGYEAMRTPLFLVWSGLAEHPMVARHRRVIAASNPRPRDIATVFDRVSGSVLERSGDVGYLATASLLDCGRRDGSGGSLPLAPFGAVQPYYPATLHMMALVAQIQRYPTCIPL